MSNVRCLVLRSVEVIIYAAGIAVLGLFYEPLKSAAGSGPLFLAGAVAYLLGLRLLGMAVRRFSESRGKR
jgi:biotin transporter BioY